MLQIIAEKDGCRQSICPLFQDWGQALRFAILDQQPINFRKAIEESQIAGLTPVVFFSPIYIFRSTFLPRWLGVLGMISGLCGLTFIYPPFGRGIFAYTAIFGLLSSVAMIVRLLIGVNEERWKEAAAAAA
ncbi:MAG: hypothetical protein QOH71_23 [Blastocatellia bacterium]|nr:hypothetical protein [Blastocatellia bacterium]